MTHIYTDPGHHAVTATATSITNVTVTAVPLALNDAFTGQGTNGGHGKTVDGLADNSSAGTSIAAVVDNNDRSYVLSVDGRRMAITRFTSTGQIDTGWATNGTYVLSNFTGVNNGDAPHALAIDPNSNYLFVAGTSNNHWAVRRINAENISTRPEEWTENTLAGSANALWLDSSESNLMLEVAGQDGNLQMEVASFYAHDDGFGHAGGSPNTDFGGGDGIAVIPNSVYGLNRTFVSASAAAVIEADDDGGFGDEHEMFVSGTVNFCNALGADAGSDMAVVDVKPDGTTEPTFGNGNGASVINSNLGCVPGTDYDSNYAMVGSTVDSTDFLTLVGTGPASVFTARFAAHDGLLDTAGYGPPSGGARKGYALVPSGAAYAAVLDSTLVDGVPVNRVIVTGAGNGTDFMAARLNDDGTLDSSFGQGGVVTIDFGSTSAYSTDGARSVFMRPLGAASSTSSSPATPTSSAPASTASRWSTCWSRTASTSSSRPQPADAVRAEARTGPCR